MLEETGAEVVGDHASAEEVKDRGAGFAPVVYLLMQSAASQGIRQEIARLRRADPGSRVAVMRAHLATHDLVEAFTAGGDGFLLEDIGAQALHESLSLIALGEKVFPSQLATLLSTDERRSDTMLRRSPLTRREREIVLCLTQGKSNKEIANELDLALATVKVHVKSLLRKLGLHNRTQAAIWALESGLIEPPEVTVKADGGPQEDSVSPDALVERASERREHLRRHAALAKALMSSSIAGGTTAYPTGSARIDELFRAEPAELPWFPTKQED